MPVHRRNVILHQPVGLSDFRCLLYKLYLTGPRIPRPGKFDDQVIPFPDRCRIPLARVVISLPPGTSPYSRAASEIDAAADRIVRGIDADGIVALEIGLEQAFVRRVLIDENGYLRPLERREKAPPGQVEPLDDEQNQEEVREIVKDVETPRSDHVLPV